MSPEIERKIANALDNINAQEFENEYERYLAEQVMIVKHLIEEHRVGDKVYVHVFERDCDMVESTTVRQIEASFSAYDKLCEQLHENAEGPVSVSVISEKEAENFVPTTRDRIAEAWDNGNLTAHIV